MKASSLFPVLALPLLLASCKNKAQTGYEDPYVANFGSDGSYNPYPSGGGGGGYEQPYDPAFASTSPATPKYETPPVTDSYSFSAPSKPAPSTSTSSSSSKPKTTASTSSSAKKKTTTTKKPVAKSSRTHTVAKGDTLYGLARKYGTSVSSIKSANGMSGDLIRLGQKLKIP